MKHVGMSQSATPATGNEATRRLKPPKVAKSDHFGKLAMGTAMRPSRGRLRTQTQERTHPQPPDPQSEKGILAMHSGKKRPMRRRCHRTFRLPAKASSAKQWPHSLWLPLGLQLLVWKGNSRGSHGASIKYRGVQLQEW